MDVQQRLPALQEVQETTEVRARRLPTHLGLSTVDEKVDQVRGRSNTMGYMPKMRGPRRSDRAYSEGFVRKGTTATNHFVVGSIGRQGGISPLQAWCDADEAGEEGYELFMEDLQARSELAVTVHREVERQNKFGYPKQFRWTLKDAQGVQIDSSVKETYNKFDMQLTTSSDKRIEKFKVVACDVLIDEDFSTDEWKVTLRSDPRWVEIERDAVTSIFSPVDKVASRKMGAVLLQNKSFLNLYEIASLDNDAIMALLPPVS